MQVFINIVEEKNKNVKKFCKSLLNCLLKCLDKQRLDKEILKYNPLKREHLKSQVKRYSFAQKDFDLRLPEVKISNLDFKRMNVKSLYTNNEFQDDEEVVKAEFYLNSFQSISTFSEPRDEEVKQLQENLLEIMELRLIKQIFSFQQLNIADGLNTLKGLDIF